MGWSSSTNNNPPALSGQNLKRVEDGIVAATNEVNSVGSALTSLTNQVNNMTGGGGGKKLIRMFTASETWNVPSQHQGKTVDVFVVGGGGGGGTADSAANFNQNDYNYSGGGGGGGQVRVWIDQVTLSSESYPITVGTGGGPDSNGSSSSAFGLTAPGGNCGGSFGEGGDGGSGGGCGGGIHPDTMMSWNPGNGGAFGSDGGSVIFTSSMSLNFQNGGQAIIVNGGKGNGNAVHSPINVYDGIAYGCGGAGGIAEAFLSAGAAPYYAPASITPAMGGGCSLDGSPFTPHMGGGGRPGANGRQGGGGGGGGSCLIPPGSGGNGIVLVYG